MTRNYLDILAETIRNNWDQPALTDFFLTEDGKAQDTSRGNHYTYGEMYEEIVRVADLLTNLGLQKGDHIAICGANSTHWVIAYLAIAKMQGVSVTVMHSLQPEEIAHLIEFSDAKALFMDKNLWSELKEQPLPQVQSVINLGDWSIMRGENISLPYREESEVGFPHQEPDNLAMICFTSGTTGRPKGVMLSYRNISANLGYSADSNLLANINKNRNTISVLPMAHMFGLITEVLYSLYYARNLYIVKGVNSSGAYISCFQIIQPLIVLLTPSMVDDIIKGVKNNKGSFVQIIQYLFGKKYKSIAISGAGLSAETEKILMEANLSIIIGYASTECMRISEASLKKHRYRSAGYKLPTVKICISPNGEILVKGENVMLGYYKDPEATAQKIDKDGWLHTGDKGHLDEDGYLYVEGRLEQDIIVLPNGENVRPDNIEALINAMPEVKESIVMARAGKLVAIVVSTEAISNQQSAISLRRNVLRTVNPQLPLFSQLYDVEISGQPLQRTEKQTIKRYLYK